MEKKKLFKILTAGVLIGSAIFCTEIKFNNANTYAYVNVLKESNSSAKVTLKNTKLKARLLEILGKKTSDDLYTDDLMGMTTYLDLSNCDIDDITELAYFSIPETLVAIDLSGNHITNDDLTKIESVLNLNENDTITYENNTITCKSNLSTLIKSINLTHNSIDLNSLNSSTLSNSKLLFGIQNLEYSATGLIKKESLSNATYYIRDDDTLLLSYNIIKDGSRFYYTTNTINPLFGDGTGSLSLGDLDITISNPPSSETGYFYGLEHTHSVTVYDIKIKDDFWVERKQFAVMNLDTTDPTKMDITTEGLNINNCTFSYISDPSTQTAGTSYISLRIAYNKSISGGETSTLVDTITLPFLVKDTTNPTITLKGYEKTYWRQNKEFVDPGAVGLDSGDDISELITTSGKVDVTQLGSYTITYTLTDRAGNKAISKTREIVVQESVLDELVITSDKENYSIGDEVILTVKPTTGTPINSYSDYKYSWFLNGVKFRETTGDETTGKSTISLILDSSLENKITVKLTAKQKLDDSTINVDSNTFEIKVKTSIASNKSIVIASAIAIALILIIIVLVYTTKAKKSKSKITKTKKTKSNNHSSQNSQNIQVYKDQSNPHNDKK